MRHLDEHRPGADARAGLPPGVWSLAAFSIAVCLFSVLGAKLLSNMFDQDDAPAPAAHGRAAGDAEMRRLAGSAPQAQAPQVVTIQHGAGVDDVTTATIQKKPTAGQTLAPCGDSPK